MEAIQAGAKFPPLIVYFDGLNYWLADGFHRYSGYKKAGIGEIEVEIRDGTQRDAKLFAMGANAAHGLRRTNGDKRKAAMTLLNDAEWGTWSDVEIAERCGVSNGFVSRLRNEISSLYGTKTERKYRRNGATYSMKTDKIGKTKASDSDDSLLLEQPAPNAQKTVPATDMKAPSVEVGAGAASEESITTKTDVVAMKSTAGSNNENDRDDFHDIWSHEEIIPGHLKEVDAKTEIALLSPQCVPWVALPKHAPTGIHLYAMLIGVSHHQAHKAALQELVECTQKLKVSLAVSWELRHLLKAPTATEQPLPEVPKTKNKNVTTPKRWAGAEADDTFDPMRK